MSNEILDDSFAGCHLIEFVWCQAGHKTNLQIQVQHEMMAQGLCRDPSCSSQAIAIIQIAFRWLWVKFPNSTFQIQKHPNHLNCSVQSRRVPRPIPFRCMICLIAYIHVLNWKQGSRSRNTDEDSLHLKPLQGAESTENVLSPKRQQETQKFKRPCEIKKDIIGIGMIRKVV